MNTKEKIIDELDDRKVNIIRFYDEEEENYATIETKEEVKMIREHLNNYKKEDEEYNIDDFLAYLNDKGVLFNTQVSAEVEIYF